MKPTSTAAAGLTLPILSTRICLHLRFEAADYDRSSATCVPSIKRLKLDTNWPLKVITRPQALVATPSSSPAIGTSSPNVRALLLLCSSGHEELLAQGGGNSDCSGQRQTPHPRESWTEAASRIVAVALMWQQVFPSVPPANIGSCKGGSREAQKRAAAV